MAHRLNFDLFVNRRAENKSQIVNKQKCSSRFRK